MALPSPQLLILLIIRESLVFPHFVSLTLVFSLAALFSVSYYYIVISMILPFSPASLGLAITFSPGSGLCHMPLAVLPLKSITKSFPSQGAFVLAVS